MSSRPESGGAARLTVDTSWGSVEVMAQQGKLFQCDLPRPAAPALAAMPSLTVRRARVQASSSADRDVLHAAEHFIRELLQGRTAPVPTWAMPAATPFRQSIWRTLARVGFGQTVSYGELARRAGHPLAVRAVGTACGANPLPLFIPCHRVLAAQGALGGFSSGLAWKERLLQLEGSR